LFHPKLSAGDQPQAIETWFEVFAAVSGIKFSKGDRLGLNIFKLPMYCPDKKTHFSHFHK
jgi:hypothetical protein